MEINKDDMKKIKQVLPWILIGVLAVLFIRECNEKKVPEYIVKEIKVEIPVIKKEFDTIYEPKAIPGPIVIDSTYYDKYKQLKDSVAKDSMFKEAIAINEYNQVFEDDVQIIDVYSKTRGELLEQNAKYETKPRTIKIKDSTEVKHKFSVNAGFDIGLPTVPTLSSTPVLRGNLMFNNKKGGTFSVGYDTEGRVWVGKTWRIGFKKLKLKL